MAQTNADRKDQINPGFEDADKERGSPK